MHLLIKTRLTYTILLSVSDTKLLYYGRRFHPTYGLQHQSQSRDIQETARGVIERCVVIDKGKGGFVTYHLGLAIDSFPDYRDFARVDLAPFVTIC